MNKLETESMPKIGKLETTVRMAERIVLRVLVMFRRFSGDENLDAIISKLMRIIMLLRLIQMTFAATVGGPLGILYAVGAGGAAAYTLIDTVGSYT